MIFLKTNFLKTKLGGLTFLFLILVGVTFQFIYFINVRNGVDQTYLLPNGFEGCVFLNYDVEGASPLKIENNEIVYKVPESGVINTSSPSDFGWTNEKHSGYYQLSAFYVGEDGEIIEKLPQEKIRFGANGSSQKEGEAMTHHSYQIFGSKEIEDKGC